MFWFHILSVEDQVSFSFQDYDFESNRKQKVGRICANVDVARKLNFTRDIAKYLNTCQRLCSEIESYYLTQDVIWLTIEENYAKKLNFIEKTCGTVLLLWNHARRSKLSLKCEIKNLKLI